MVFRNRAISITDFCATTAAGAEASTTTPDKKLPTTVLPVTRTPAEPSTLTPSPLPAIVFAALYLGYTIWMEHRAARTDKVNHSAHLSGAIYGVLFMVLMEPRVLAAFVQALAHPSFGAG